MNLKIYLIQGLDFLNDRCQKILSNNDEFVLVTCHRRENILKSKKALKA